MSRNRIIGLAVLAAAALVALAVVIVMMNDSKPRTASGVIGSSGHADIGGDFTLTAHTGERVNTRDFRGRYLLVFFGYTFCPQICPTGLQTITTALDELGDAAERIQPLFVTVDPPRDTVAVMRDYLEAFHPRLIGLTGTAEEIRTAAKLYKVYYARAPGGMSGKKTMPSGGGDNHDGHDAQSNSESGHGKHSSHGGDDDNYMVDHSSIIYLMDPEGRFVKHFTYKTDPKTMAAALRDILGWGFHRIGDMCPEN